jgi:hypothetical protein
MTNSQCAKEIAKAAKLWLSNVKDRAVRSDVDLADCYRSDAKALREIATLLRQNKHTDAVKKAEHLDSIVRDIIPENCWRHLHPNF